MHRRHRRRPTPQRPRPRHPAAPARAFLLACTLLAPALAASGAAAQEDDDERWRLDLGFTLNSTGGNQELTMLTSELGLSHLETDRYEMDLGLRFRYGRSKGERVAQNMRGSLGLDLHPEHDWSPFLFLTAERDPFRRLDLRLNSGSGVKRTFWRDGWQEVSLSGAILYSEERVEVVDPLAEPRSRTARWSWRGRLRRTLGEGRRAEHVTYYQPVWDRGGDYLLESQTSIRLSLTEHLSLNTAFLFERDSTPPEDVDPDDWNVRVGLGIATRW